MPAAKKPSASPAQKGRKPSAAVSRRKVALEFGISTVLEGVNKRTVESARGGKYIVFTSPLKPRHLSAEKIAKAVAELP